MALPHCFTNIQSTSYSAPNILKCSSFLPFVWLLLRNHSFKQPTSIFYNGGNLSRFEQRRIKKGNLEKTVIGPLEFLLTNYPGVAISYVTKEESVSDFSEAVSSASYGMHPKATV